MSLWEYYDLKQDFYFVMAALYVFTHDGWGEWVVMGAAFISIVVMSIRKNRWENENGRVLREVKTRRA